MVFSAQGYVLFDNTVLDKLRWLSQAEQSCSNKKAHQASRMEWFGANQHSHFTRGNSKRLDMLLNH
jgi:hypothetical protein